MRMTTALLVTTTGVGLWAISGLLGIFVNDGLGGDVLRRPLVRVALERSSVFGVSERQAWHEASRALQELNHYTIYCEKDSSDDGNHICEGGGFVTLTSAKQPSNNELWKVDYKDGRYFSRMVVSFNGGAVDELIVCKSREEFLVIC